MTSVGIDPHQRDAPVACGARDVLPFAVSVFQFAIAIGATIAAADVDPLGALAGSALLSAGSAQLAGIELLDGGATVLVAAGSAVLINARFVLYGAGFASWFGGEPRWRRYAMVFPIVDQSFVLCERRFRDHTDPRWRRHYYLVVIAGLFTAFLAGQIVGFLAGDLVPSVVGLRLAGPLVFAGLLAVTVTDRKTSVSALAAGASIAVAAPLLGGGSLLVAAILGVLAGSVVTPRSGGAPS
jgi:predicted branched-subunit amino acid permease